MMLNSSEAISKTAETALKLIRSAFANRETPTEITDSNQLSDSEYQEVISFEGLQWQDVSVALVEQAPDSVFWFSPEAFCYYLPGVLSAGISTGRSDLLYSDALIGCLDRSPELDYWDDFFYPRFTLLSAEEINAVSAWARWMALVEPEAYLEFTYQRVQGTLDLLRQRAIGMASSK
ncbi:MAG: hypothetical protein KJN90_02830 [Gammaproteobacteria bacterium]|nr:hypothetical protein [Gammaproteobacteria bacterium]